MGVGEAFGKNGGDTMRARAILMAASAALAIGSRASDADPVRVDTSSVIDRWVDSVGGYTALNSVRSLESNETREEASDPAPLASHTLVLGMNLRVEVTMPGGGSLVYGTNGKNYWVDGGDLGFGVMDPSDFSTLNVAHNPTLPFAIRNSYAYADDFPDEIHEGEQCRVFCMHPTSGPEELWYFNLDSGQLTSIVLERNRPKVTINFSDYRKAGPILVPFELSIYVGEKRVYAVHRQSVNVNVALNDSYFTPFPWELNEAKAAKSALDRYRAVCVPNPAGFAAKSRQLKLSIDTPSTGVSSERSITIVYPNKILVDTSTKGIGHDLQGFDGTTGWAYNELQGFHLLKPTEISPLFGSLSQLGDPNIESEAPLRHVIGTRLVNGQRATAIALSTLKAPLGVFYFDEENGHLVRITSVQRSKSNNSPRATLDFSDFKSVNGRDIPFTATETNSTYQVISKIEAVVDNPEVPDSTFAPRRDD